MTGVTGGTGQKSRPAIHLWHIAGVDDRVLPVLKFSILETLLVRVAPGVALSVHRDESHQEIIDLFVLWLLADQALDCEPAGLLRALPRPHHLDDHRRSGDLDDRFAEAGGGRGTGFIVDKKSGADNR